MTNNDTRSFAVGGGIAMRLDIGGFFKEDRAYFAGCKRSITAHNNHMLCDGCILYSLVLIFYTILSLATGQSSLLKNMYYVFGGFHVLLTTAVFLRPAKLRESYRATQIFCAILELSILSFFALEGAVATPSQHSLYVPIAILLLQLLFIHRAAYSFLIIFFYTAAFALLSRLSKIPAAYTNDLYIAVATFISANIGYTMIAKLRRNEQQALTKFENLSRMDALTGLYNKATLEQLCRRCIEEWDHACTLVIVDLDDFKRINDEYGHDTGDEVLKSVGTAIIGSFRANDIMGRFGGDEFVILLDACDDPAVVGNRMEALERKIAELRFSIPVLSVHYSVGMAFKQKNDDFRSVFARADQALYVAKREGKSQGRGGRDAEA